MSEILHIRLSRLRSKALSAGPQQSKPQELSNYLLSRLGGIFALKKKIEKKTVLEAFPNSCNMHRLFPPQMAVKHLIGLL